jgi:hypothetical protein
MNSKEQTPDQWVSDLTDLIETYRSLITVRVVQHTSLGISMGMLGILTSALVLFVFLFSGLGFAWWLGEYLNDMKLGFFIMGGAYSIVLITLILMARQVLMPRIRNYIIKKIYEQD